ncbi:MAG: tetratricopeptide repeat protein, partial [Candidatus Latescibacterota bacterium]|nr:tetratricopeptide repeat protein [Candidatus Latescibacterota bacterium]
MSPFAAFFGLPVAWILLTGATVGDPVASKSAEALRLFEQGAFDQALQLYRDAQLERPDEPALNFNVGNSLFKQGDLEAALQELSRAAEQAEGTLGASAHYNMGNAWFQKQQYEQAIASYRQALERNSNDRDAKANLELALQKLEEQQQQEQQKQQQQQKHQHRQQHQQQHEQRKLLLLLSPFVAGFAQRKQRDWVRVGVAVFR